MFKNPFSFEGRIRRTEFGLTLIIYVIVVSILSAIIEPNSYGSQSSGSGFALFIYIPLLWFLWAQGAKRCHDLGNSGWFQIIPFYPLWMLFQNGQIGGNEYGENPKDIELEFNSNGSIAYQAVSNNLEENAELNLEYYESADLKAQLINLNKSIKDETNSMFSTNKRMEILNTISDLSYDKDAAIQLLIAYKKLAGTDLINDLMKMNNSYSAIKQNLATFIELDIIEPEDPHNRKT